MCEACLDADKKQILLNSGSCDGQEMRHLTFFELQRELEEEFKETGKSEFRIFTEAVTDLEPTKTSALWDYEGHHLKVNFVPLH